LLASVLSADKACSKRRHDSNQEKQRELKQNDEPAENERLLASRVMAASEQPLHDN